MEKKLKTAVYITGVMLILSLTALGAALTVNQVILSRYAGLDSVRLPTIHLHAEGVVYADPQSAEMLFAVITEAEDAGDALSENNLRMTRVLEYLKEKGVEEPELRTGNLQIQPVYERKQGAVTGRTGTRISGYRALNTVEAKIRELDKAGSIASGAVEAGANRLDRFRFIVEDMEKYRTRARSKAVSRAKEKGEETAAALGLKLGRLLNFSEERDSFTPVMARQQVLDAEPHPVPLEPGENRIVVNVHLEYELKF